MNKPSDKYSGLEGDTIWVLKWGGSVSCLIHKTEFLFFNLDLFWEIAKDVTFPNVTVQLKIIADICDFESSKNKPIGIFIFGIRFYNRISFGIFIIYIIIVYPI